MSLTLAVFAVIADACPEVIVVVFPAIAVAEVVPMTKDVAKLPWPVTYSAADPAHVNPKAGAVVGFVTVTSKASPAIVALTVVTVPVPPPPLPINVAIEPIVNCTVLFSSVVGSICEPITLSFNVGVP